MSVSLCVHLQPFAHSEFVVTLYSMRDIHITLSHWIKHKIKTDMQRKIRAKCFTHTVGDRAINYSFLSLKRRLRSTGKHKHSTAPSTLMPRWLFPLSSGSLWTYWAMINIWLMDQHFSCLFIQWGFKAERVFTDFMLKSEMARDNEEIRTWSSWIMTSTTENTCSNINYRQKVMELTSWREVQSWHYKLQWKCRLSHRQVVK